MFVAIGLFLAKVAVFTVTAAVVATGVVVMGAGTAGTVRNVRDGATQVVADPRSRGTHELVDRWDDPEYWRDTQGQDRDMNAEWSGRQIQRQLAGGAAVGLEAVKAANPSSKLADGVQVMDGAVEVNDYLTNRLATSAAQTSASSPTPSDIASASTPASSAPPDPTPRRSTPQSTPVAADPTPSTSMPEQSVESANGLYTLDTGAFAESLPASVLEASGEVLIDDRADVPVRGSLSATFVNEAGGPGWTDWELWSEDPPVLDSEGQWDLSLYLRRNGEEPYLFAATIRHGELTFVTAPFGLEVAFSR